MNIIKNWMTYRVKKIKEYNRFNLRNKIDRLRLTNKDFSIISQNCIGGFMSHDLGVRFNSPTINLYFEAVDYIRFLENLDYYLACTLTFEENSLTYPIGYLDDVKIYFVHYASIDDAKNKWEERKKRLNKDNLFIIMTDRDGCNFEILKRFDQLPYKNKIIFTAQKYDEFKSVVWLKQYQNYDKVGQLHVVQSLNGKRGYNIGFDYVYWLNNY